MIIVDVETTGIDTDRCSIVSIGAIDFASLETFYQENRMFRNALIEQEALDLNGFTRKEIRDSKKPSLERNVMDFLMWIDNFEDKTLAGQNVHYDSRILKVSAERYNLPWVSGYGIVDLHSLTVGHQLRRGLNPIMHDNRAALRGDEIYNYVGMNNEPKPHNALKGVLYEAEAFSRIIYGKNLLPQFKDLSIPDYLK